MHIVVKLPNIMHESINAKCLFNAVKNQTHHRKYLLELNKRRLKVDQKNVSLEQALNFDQ